MGQPFSSTDPFIISPRDTTLQHMQIEPPLLPRDEQCALVPYINNWAFEFKC